MLFRQWRFVCRVPRHEANPQLFYQRECKQNAHITAQLTSKNVNQFAKCFFYMIQKSTCEIQYEVEIINKD